SPNLYSSSSSPANRKQLAAMAQCKPKVCYFNARGRAELIRLALTAGGVEFDDVRFTREEWPEKKKIAPTGVAPWVETPNGKLVQSGAIARFIAKKHGLYGEGDWEFYLVERALAQIDDVATELMKMYFAPEDKKSELVKQFQTEKGPKLIEGLLKFIEDGGSGFFAGKSVTLADLASVNMVDQLALVPELLAKFPQLEAHKKRVLEAKPKVAEWIKNRPQTPV
ncbi:hypothetical protein BOX15_Mlig031684g1, partial [Macrostomum lignano]